MNQSRIYMQKNKLNKCYWLYSSDLALVLESDGSFNYSVSKLSYVMLVLHIYHIFAQYGINKFWIMQPPCGKIKVLYIEFE